MDNNEENITKYGEEIASEFAWIPIEKQKDIANKLSKITNSSKKKKKS